MELELEGCARSETPFAFSVFFVVELSVLLPVPSPVLVLLSLFPLHPTSLIVAGFLLLVVGVGSCGASPRSFPACGGPVNFLNDVQALVKGVRLLPDRLSLYDASPSFLMRLSPCRFMWRQVSVTSSSMNVTLLASVQSSPLVTSIRVKNS